MYLTRGQVVLQVIHSAPQTVAVPNTDTGRQTHSFPLALSSPVSASDILSYSSYVSSSILICIRFQLSVHLKRCADGV